ncbi:MAG TPA: DUF3160 domain-containing protein [Polyangiaceae bacterium]|nr:DUF3160 domain-containing protein [Polyangiaceae bacterium]
MKLSRLAFALALGCACSSRRFPETALIAKAELDLGAHALSTTQTKVLGDSGFAILDDVRPKSFFLGYTSIFHAHQPVYVTADALLYAWHTSYDTILERIELTSMIDELGALVDAVRARTRDVDARTYLDVARSLLRGSVTGGPDVQRIVAAAESASGPGEISLFGGTMPFDFSMLKPRGHYTHSIELERYFRAMSWLGRAEIRLAERDAGKPWVTNHAAMRSAIDLASAMKGEPMTRWRRIDGMLSALLGPADSLSPNALTPFTLGSHADGEIVSALENAAHQNIRTQMLSAGHETLAVLFMGQRAVADAQVLSDLTVGTLATNPPRLMPSPLDVAATTFHNAAARQLLAPDVERYGKPYADALDAIAKRDLDTGNMHHLWLASLRALSPDETRDAKLPAPLHGDAWARRMLDAQLASWAELRHDNMLYAKQSFSAVIMCAYPHGYVDPYPAFYEAMERIADSGLALAATLAAKVGNLGAYFDKMKRTMSRLHAMATHEQRDEPMTSDDLEFLNHMVSVDGHSGGCGGPILEVTGWYADLFYDHGEILGYKPIIADVHTQPTDESGAMVGRVLHVGTAPPRMLVVRLDHDRGENATVYRGFVSTYAERITTGFARYTDEQWRAEIATHPPENPPWMHDIATH